MFETAVHAPFRSSLDALGSVNREMKWRVKIEGIVDDSCMLRNCGADRGTGTAGLVGPLAAPPSLFDEEGQILCPVVGGHAAGIDHMSQIIFGVRQYKRRVIDPIVVATMRR